MTAILKAGDLLAAYGMLRPASPEQPPAFIMAGLRHVRPCKIAGQIIDLGGYPGLIPGPGEVACDLMSLASPAAGRQIDAFEDFTPETPETSRYIRKPTPLLGEDTVAWAYWWNEDWRGHASIASGDWLNR